MTGAGTECTGELLPENTVFEFNGVRVRAQPILRKGYGHSNCPGCMAAEDGVLCLELPPCVGQKGANLIFVVEEKPALT